MPPDDPCPIWIESQYSLIPSLDIAGKVPTDTSILILNRKNDSQTPIRQSLFEYLLMQVFDIKEAAVFIPLGFGLLVGLVYAIISSIRRKD